MGWWIHGVGAAVSNLPRDLGSLHGSRPRQPARHSPQKPGHGEEHRLLPAADKGKTRSLCRKEGNVLFNDTLNTFYLRLYGVGHNYGKGRKEGNVLFNDALNTFYLRLYGIRHMVKEERKEMFYLTMHSTHFIYGYMASGIW